MADNLLIRLFVGIDPGFTGAIGFIAERELCNDIFVWDFMVSGAGRKRQFDLENLNRQIHGIQGWGTDDDVIVGLENPTTRPGEGAEPCKRFGEGIGFLKGMMTAHQVPYTCVPPNLWKGRLGLPGKTHRNANKSGAQLLITHYPNAENLIYGPRGGILDGRLDALLIAHWMKVNYEKEQK